MKRRFFWKDVICYEVVMLAGIAITSAVQGTSTIFWAVYIAGFFTIFFPYLFKGTKKAWFFLFLYLILSVVTILLNIKYFLLDIKTIGLSSASIITPLFIMLFGYIRLKPKFGNDEIKSMLSVMSIVGNIIVLYTWAVSVQDIIGTLTGSIGAYNADLFGFFNSKNSYGAYVSLSMCSDIYLYKHEKEKRKFRILSIIIKGVAVLISYSRAALLLAAVTIVLFFMLEIAQSIKEWGGAILGISGLIIFAQKSPKIQNYLLNQVIRVQSGDAGRGGAREYALSKFTDFKDYIFGLGYGGLSYFNIDIDNSWYYLIITGGIIKFVIYVVIIIFAARQIMRIRKSNFELGNICLAVTASYIIYAMFESVPLLELGLINFMFMVYIFIIPYGYDKNFVSEKVSSK